MESLDLSPYATTSDLQSALQQQSEASESALKQSSEAVAELGGRMEGVETDLARLTEQIDELQVRLTPTLSRPGYAEQLNRSDGNSVSVLTSVYIGIHVIVITVPHTDNQVEYIRHGINDATRYRRGCQSATQAGGATEQNSPD